MNRNSAYAHVIWFGPVSLPLFPSFGWGDSSVAARPPAVSAHPSNRLSTSLCTDRECVHDEADKPMEDSAAEAGGGIIELGRNYLEFGSTYGKQKQEFVRSLENHILCVIDLHRHTLRPVREPAGQQFVQVGAPIVPNC